MHELFCVALIEGTTAFLHLLHVDFYEIQIKMFHGMILFDFAEMDRLKNGNSMTASSRSTALAIVADLLRRVNVGVP